MLPSSAQVRTVYSSIIPALRNLHPDDKQHTVCIDSTTLDVSVAQEVAKEVITSGVRMVDAPVSGGVTGAKAGTLAFLVGGTAEDFKSVEPTLALMGQRIVHCGPSGAGLGAKICNNLILGVQQIVVAEAMILGQNLGLDPAVLSSVIGSSTGNCWSLSVNNPVPHALGPEKSPPCERDYEGGFATALMEKDMGLASDIATKTGTRLPLGDAALELYAKMIKERPELGKKDFSSVYEYIRTALHHRGTLLPPHLLPFRPPVLATPMALPNVLIFGGLNTCSRALVGLLAPIDGEPLVSHVRIVDRFSVEPPTTYIGAEFPKILNKDSKVVEYKQANLTVPATIAQMYDPPAGQEPYDYVFDFTGEVQFDRTEMIQIDRTCNVALLLGQEAARRKVKAYCRLSLPFYETSSKGAHDEKEDIKPDGVRGTWWHEALRMLAAIEDLNLVILRTGLIYGPYMNYGIITSVITVASVYGYLKQPMKSMWSPGKHPMNTVHTDDIAGAMWALAQWMAPLGRKEADILAGEIILFRNDKSKVAEVKGMPDPSKKLVAPVFNLTDMSNNTLASIGTTVTSFFGTTFEFFNFVENTVLNLKSDAVEDINEHHVGAWTEMITTSNPPIPNTPLSAYMDKYALDKHVVAFSNQKLLEITGYKLKRPEFNHDTVKDIVDRYKAEGTWPNLAT
ncbi:NAD dependent epimerase dehydratase family protein [Mycena chlorophos]|uniref:3-hydroxyisobutyrate dehydrogenase n=1 Tax=Mycena chlorophos TaxID=658473 RepID=A0A8H6TRP4_MYCCL|nr:NAD dependent epimerase dehydratase family protein [Mycena chlorophos]